MKNDEIVKTDNLIPQDFPFNIAWKEYKEANKNIEVFKRFQEAARVNPNLTYAEFVKSLN